MRLSLAYISIALGCTFVGYGQSEDTLKTVEVFAKADSIHTFSVINAAVPLYKFNEERLQNLGVHDIGQALKQVPGANIKDYGGIGGISTISFRSLGANHTSVELDDFILPSLQSGTVNLNQFTIFGVEALELSTGQVQHLTASAAAYQKSNLISVFSKIGSAPKFKTEVQAMGSYQSVQLGQAGLLIKQKIGKYFTFGIQSMIRDGNGAYAYSKTNGDSTYTANRSPSNLKNTQLRTVLQFQEKNHYFSIASSISKQTQKLPGAVILYNPYNHQYLGQDQQNISFKYQFKNKQHYLGINAFHRKENTVYTDSAYLNSVGYLSNSYLINEQGVGFMYRYFLGSPTQAVFIGSDLISGSLTGNQYFQNPSRQSIISVVGITKWLYRFKFQGNITHQHIEDKGLEQGSSYQKYSPLIAIAYLPFDHSKIRFRTHYKNTYRLPSFNDLYYNLIGNKNLKPENVSSLNVGITYSKKLKFFKLETSVDLYQNQVENKIVAIPTQNLFNWSIQNIGNVSARGIDFSIQALKTFKKIKIIANVGQNFNQSIDQTIGNNFSFGHQIPYTPIYNGMYNLSISKEKQTLNVNVIHSGARYALNQNIPSNYLKGFTDIAIGYSYKYSIKKQADLTFFLNLNNILNNNYEVIKSFPMPGRHLVFKMIFNFKK